MATRDMRGRTCVVTGSTSGIGLAIATALAARGARVVMAGPDRAEAERAQARVAAATGSDALELEVADFSTMDAVRAFAASIRSRHAVIDVLVNNAGLLSHEASRTGQGMSKTWAVNYFAPFLLTHLLLEPLAAASQGRIVNTASIAHRWGRLPRGPEPSSSRRGRLAGVLEYFDTKLALVVFTRRMATRLPATVTCNCFHPGIIGTDIAVGRGVIGRLMRLGKPIMKRPEDGARTAVFLASDPGVGEISGAYFVDERPHPASRKVHDDAAADALWRRSIEVTGIGG